MNSQNTVNRIEYIDTAKAIAILSVIVGHCYWIKSIPYGIDVIYSFHMSLFFIVSGYFSKPLLLKDAIIKFLKAYIKPLAFTVVIALILVIIGDLIKGEPIIETTKEWSARRRIVSSLSRTFLSFTTAFPNLLSSLNLSSTS